ncbi:MAG: methyltransferase domain-containing protein [Syntrophobacteraceae bacterium]|nr:methyltransferase domain-containing protein [Syntrophobacteraceae bacterium]
MAGTALIFDRNVDKWILYTKSVKGRLLHELARDHLKRQLSLAGAPMRVLDAGCGPADMAYPLFPIARELVLLDFSPKMIEGAKKRLAVRYTPVEMERITFVNAAVEQLDCCLPQGSFDLIVCHNTLEYTKDPGAALGALAKRLAAGGLLSLVVANRFSEAFRLAFAKCDLDGARLALHTGTATAELFDHAPKRTFSFDQLDQMVGKLGLSVLARHGIRIFTDYLPVELIEDERNFPLLLALEKEAASRIPYIAVARYLQLVCRK